MPTTSCARRRLTVSFRQDPGSAKITQPATDLATPQSQPRARGLARVSSKARDGKSVIDGLHQSGAMKVLFPQGRQDLEAILINTSGGITGGDQFRIEAEAGAASTLTLTTQAAERAYRAQPGETGRVATRLSVTEGARLNWLPQELILYDGAALERRLSVELAEHARLLMAEPVIFGRAAMGEVLGRVQFEDRIEVSRGGVPLYRDGIRLTGHVAAQLSRSALARGAGAMASLLYVAPDAETVLAPVRADLPDTGGATLLAPDVLALRLLAPDAFALRKSLLPILDRLTSNTLPASWRL